MGGGEQLAASRAGSQILASIKIPNLNIRNLLNALLRPGRNDARIIRKII